MLLHTTATQLLMVHAFETDRIRRSGEQPLRHPPLPLFRSYFVLNSNRHCALYHAIMRSGIQRHGPALLPIRQIEPKGIGPLSGIHLHGYDLLFVRILVIPRDLHPGFSALRSRSRHQHGDCKYRPTSSRAHCADNRRRFAELGCLQSGGLTWFFTATIYC